MKKLMRIALVFALAGATLVGCTKDYSGDISDLNKKVAEQQSAVTALQNAVSNAQTAADNALANAQNALKEAQAAAKAAADANNDAEVAALTAKVATIEGEIADLEAKVKALDGLEAKLNEVADQLKKDVDAKVDAALEEVRAELEKALALVEGNFNVTAVKASATYAYAKWDPETSQAGKKRYEKLAKVFPELAEIKKGDVIEMFGALPFIVNPSSVELDDTYTFSLVDKSGEDTGIILGNPTVGYDVKAGANVWNVEVQSPALNTKSVYGAFEDLALVVENANGVSAQTTFEYAVNASKSNESHFTLQDAKYDLQYRGKDFDGNTVDLKNILIPVDKSHWAWSWPPRWISDKSAPLYENYFILEANDEAIVEKYGVSVEGTKVTIENGPKAGGSEKKSEDIKLTLTAIGVNGKTSEATITLNLTSAPIEANAELAAKEITLAKDKNYVKYDVADFGFSALEWRSVFTELSKNTSTATIYDPETGSETNFVKKTDSYSVIFFKKDGKVYSGSTYSEAVAFGFEIDPAEAVPGTYPVRITDGAVFCGDGEVTVANPEAHAIKPIPAFCDENGVLQIVGTPGAKFITYELKNAFVTAISGVAVPSSLTFTDEDATYDEDSWVIDNKLQVYKNSDDHHDLYTVRNFSVKYPLFGNDENLVSLDFQAEVISPIYDAEGKSIAVTDPTIYVNKDEEAKKFSSVAVKDFVGKGTFVAGFEYKGNPFNIYNVWTTTPIGGSDPVYKYWETEGDYAVPPFNKGDNNKKTFENYKNYLAGWGEGWSDWLVSTKDGLRIEIEKEDVTIKNLIALGFSSTGADTFYYDAYGTDEHPALYLTGVMFTKLQPVYAKYYDVKGKALTEEIWVWYKETDTAVKKSMTVYTCYSAEYDDFKNGKDGNVIWKTEDNDKLMAKWTKIDEDDNAAVALFKKYQNKFGEITTPAVKPTDKPAIEKNGGRHEFVTKVEVKLSETAETFISPSKLTDPYDEAETPSTFALKTDAGTKLSGDSVVIPGEVVVTDAWGMVTKKAFNLTIKTR